MRACVSVCAGRCGEGSTQRIEESFVSLIEETEDRRGWTLGRLTWGKGWGWGGEIPSPDGCVRFRQMISLVWMRTDVKADTATMLSYWQSIYWQMNDAFEETAKQKNMVGYTTLKKPMASVFR